MKYLVQYNVHTDLVHIFRPIGIVDKERMQKFDGLREFDNVKVGLRDIDEKALEQLLAHPTAS